MFSFRGNGKCSILRRRAKPLGCYDYFCAHRLTQVHGDILPQRLQTGLTQSTPKIFRRTVGLCWFSAPDIKTCRYPWTTFYARSTSGRQSDELCANGRRRSYLRRLFCQNLKCHTPHSDSSFPNDRLISKHVYYPEKHAGTFGMCAVLA